MTTWYNENDPFAAEWLRQLISAGAIAPGVVDERDIQDVVPDELHQYTQCHFFAGIGIWSAALRGVGWPDTRPVWTGSCPCQPFSTAGKGKGFADERHLWPYWHHVIAECKPPVIFGEQTGGKNGYRWLDLVQADLEAVDYACGAVDFCAAGVGAPIMRNRVLFVARTIGERLERFAGDGDGCDKPGRVAQRSNGSTTAQGAISSVAGTDRPGSFNGYWEDADWLRCRDDKWRPVETGTFPLAVGDFARVGRLRGYGNSLNQKATEHFIATYMEM